MKRLVSFLFCVLLLLSVVAVAEEPIEVGNVIAFGSYKQDYNPIKSGSSIEWIILDYYPEDNLALVLSKYVLDVQALHDSEEYPTWEKSNIRTWLNGAFLETAFTEEEREAILLVPVQTPDNNGIDGGPDTEDKVFLLSSGEVNVFLKDENLRIGVPTKTVVALGIEIEKESGNCRWWLRDPGYRFKYGQMVVYDGETNGGWYYPREANGIRPAMWVRLDLIGQ